MDVADLLAEETCTCLLHNCSLKNKNGESTNGHEASENKIVVLYFTSNWCEPCHTFTKLLSQAYRLMEKRASELLFVNVPVESDPEQAMYCYDTMPDSWYTISADSQHVKTFISKYSIRTVPKLIVCKSDGSTITHKGRSEIESKLAAAAYNWIETSRAKPTKEESTQPGPATTS